MDRAYRAVLFDLDGPLLDTLADLADCMNRVLGRHGFPAHPPDSYRYFVGDGVENLVRRTLPAERRDEATLRALKADMKEEYGAHWADKTRPYPGIPALLKSLHTRRVPMAVLSNKPHSLTVAVVTHFFGLSPFAAVFGARDGHPHKPDPGAALEIASALALAPAEVLYAGDTDTDMQTAARAGMFAVGVLWGFRPREELLESGAQALAASPADLLAYFT